MSTLPAQSPPAEDLLGSILREYTEVADRLQRTHETLQDEVVRLRDELASKDRELERKRRLAALGELAAGVAHEVRNPLGAIQLYSGLLKRACKTAPAALELIEKIEAGVQAIDGVVKDTLALTPSGGRFVTRPLREVVEAAADTCRAALESRDVRLSIASDIEDASVYADVAGLQRAIVNLISNAAEASQPGGEVIARLDREDTRLRIRIIDNGCGIPAEVLDQIFDPFFTTRPNGTGLGLTIAHRLVEAHQGSLTAANRPEGGAVFTVVLPCNGAKGKDAKSPKSRISAA
ncbi:MAG: hypothetical protein KDA32_08990 [Phycisphaerales bacterium]|nr:hypothetical protein [Phycisphaerales bacterium]